MLVPSASQGPTHQDRTRPPIGKGCLESKDPFSCHVVMASVLFKTIFQAKQAQPGTASVDFGGYDDPNCLGAILYCLLDATVVMLGESLLFGEYRCSANPVSAVRRA